MKPSSKMDKVELVYVDLHCSTIIISPSLTQIDQKCFPIVGKLFPEP
jgi:hypothetical protein